MKMSSTSTSLGALTKVAMVTLTTMMTTTMLMTMLTILPTIPGTWGFGRGAPGYACNSMKPGHPSTPQVFDPATFPFDITLSPNPALPGDIVTVRVAVRDPAQVRYGRFLGLLSRVAGPSSGVNTGFTNVEENGFKLITCRKVDGGAITHRSKLNVTAASFGWRVPSDARLGTQFTIRMTLVANVSTFWVKLNHTLTVGLPATTAAPNPPLLGALQPGSKPTGTGTGTASQSGASGAAPSWGIGVMPSDGPGPMMTSLDQPGDTGNHISSSSSNPPKPSPASQVETQDPSVTNMVDGPQFSSLPLDNLDNSIGSGMETPAKPPRQNSLVGGNRGSGVAVGGGGRGVVGRRPINNRPNGVAAALRGNAGSRGTTRRPVHNGGAGSGVVGGRGGQASQQINNNRQTSQQLNNNRGSQASQQLSNNRQVGNRDGRGQTNAGGRRWQTQVHEPAEDVRVMASWLSAWFGRR